MANDTESAPHAPPWRNPWLGAALAGMIFVTVMRPCTRREPPPPPSMGELPAGIGNEKSPISTSVPTVLGRIEFPCESECEATLRSLEQLVEGHTTWESPVKVRILVEGPASPALDAKLDTTVEAARIFSTREAADALTSLCGASDAPGSLILVDAARDVRGCYPATVEGTKEAFHRSVRTWREGLAPDPTQPQ